MDAVRKLASAEGKPMYAVQKRAVAILTTIKASLSRAICRIVGYLLFKVFRKITKRILVAPAQMAAVKKAEEVILLKRVPFLLSVTTKFFRPVYR